MKKILFITHEASRTGAPFVLYYLLEWIKINESDIDISLLTLEDGELKNDFKNICTNYYSLKSIKDNPKSNLLKKILSKIGVKETFKEREESFLKLIALQKFDLIYSNTILSIPFGNTIKSYTKNTKHIVHVHELNAILKLKCPNFKKHSKNIDHFIAASDVVKNNLIKNWQIPEETITRVYECSRVKLQKVKKEEKEFCVGGSGTVHWRKGSDLFIQIATIFKNKYPSEKIKFIWVGGISKIEKIIIEEDLDKAELNGVVTFVGQVENPSEYYNDFDLFLMTSREDPFPLVCIEVGMLGKPILCFKGATGSEEIIKKGGGAIVPYLDTNAMVDEIIAYKNSHEKLKVHGEISKKEFSKFSPEIICPQLYNVMKAIN